jgi:hypothetical protein
LTNHSFLLLGQVWVDRAGRLSGRILTRRILASREADAAQNRKGDGACAKESIHDGLLSCGIENGRRYRATLHPTA